MDRQERDRNEYGRYDGYSPNDEHYHSARNLTDEFEQEYERRRGYRDNDRYSQNHTYHEGNMGDAYERYSRQGSDHGNYAGNQRNDWDRNRNYANTYSSDRNSNYQDGFSGDQDRYRRDRESGRDYGNVRQGNIRQGYGISGFAGTSDRFNTLNSDQNRGGAGNDRAYYGGFGSSRSGGGMGDSFPGSHRGVPDASYGLGNFSDNYGTGMGSSYGGRNYGGGTGYSGGHRGGSFGNGTYGSSAGNYGGFGAMGGGTYGGRNSSSRGDTSHNSDRGTRELGGF